jgi:hypothetical protein
MWSEYPRSLAEQIQDEFRDAQRLAPETGTDLRFFELLRLRVLTIPGVSSLHLHHSRTTATLGMHPAASEADTLLALRELDILLPTGWAVIEGLPLDGSHEVT